jgi:hypothetical protein
MSEIYYDSYDFGIDSDPHPVWRCMRDEAPLYRNDPGPDVHTAANCGARAADP